MLPFYPKISIIMNQSEIKTQTATFVASSLLSQKPFSSVQFSSVAQSCPTLCDPMNRSTPGLPVHHQLPEFTQTHVHRVGDAIQPSHPLLSPLEQGIFMNYKQKCQVYTVSSYVSSVLFTVVLLSILRILYAQNGINKNLSICVIFSSLVFMICLYLVILFIILIIG